MESETLQFQNMDSWRSGSSGMYGLTFKQIVLMHINKCVSNGSVEWRGGYWNETGSNPATRTYVPNSRDVYSNSVKMLRACLLGYFDEQMSNADEKLQKEFRKNFEFYSGKSEKEKLYEWYDFKIEWHIRLFEELILLSKRLNFFEEQVTEEEM